MNRLTLAVYYVLFALVFMCANKIGIMSIISNRVAFIALVLTFLTAVAENKFRKLPSFVYLWIFLSVYGIMTMFWSPYPDSTYIKSMWMFYVALIFSLAFLAVRTEGHLVGVLKSVCVGTGLLLLGTFYSYLTKSPYAFTDAGVLSTSYRYSFSTINPNYAGAVFALCLPIAWWLFDNEDKVGKTFRFFSLLLVVLLPVGIILTASRGAAFASVFGLAYIVVSVLRSKRRYKNAFYAICIILSCVFVFTYLRSGGNIDKAFERIVGPGFDLKSKNVADRLEMWSQTWNIFAEHPLIGVGIGSGRTEFESIGVLSVSHNVVLSILSEYGLIGFFLFLALVVISIRSALQCPPGYRAMSLICLGTLFLIAMKESFEPEPFFWVTLALPVISRGALLTFSSGLLCSKQQPCLVRSSLS